MNRRLSKDKNASHGNLSCDNLFASQNLKTKSFSKPNLQNAKTNSRLASPVIKNKNKSKKVSVAFSPFELILSMCQDKIVDLNEIRLLYQQHPEIIPPKDQGMLSFPFAAAASHLCPLHFAAANGNLELVQFLLEIGFNPNVKDCEGWTLLHCASAEEKYEVVEWVVLNVKEVDLNATTLVDISETNESEAVGDFIWDVCENDQLKQKMKGK